MDASNLSAKMDLAELPPAQQDRVIRFASELAKSLRQIKMTTEQQRQNANAQKDIEKTSEKERNNEPK